MAIDHDEKPKEGLFNHLHSDSKGRNSEVQVTLQREIGRTIVPDLDYSVFDSVIEQGDTLVADLVNLVPDPDLNQYWYLIQWTLMRILKKRLNLECKRLLAHYDNSGGSSFLGLFIQKRKFREWLIPWAVHSEGYNKLSTYNSGEGSFSGLISPWCKFCEWLIPWGVHSDCCGLVISVTRKPEGVSESVQEHICSERLLSLKIIQPEAKIRESSNLRKSSFTFI
jgi:hypothetical protein